jgi:SacI homology domain
MEKAKNVRLVIAVMAQSNFIDGASIFILGMEETREAVRRHFERELSIYQQQCIVSLVEQNGKEKVIDDAYMEHIRLLNEPRLIYVTFDFHEHWYAKQTNQYS